jgi:hypothetical protein
LLIGCNAVLAAVAVLSGLELQDPVSALALAPTAELRARKTEQQAGGENDETPH